MRQLALPFLFAGAAAIGACAATPPPPPGAAPAESVAASGVCGSYGYVDINNDGWISGDEWNTYRTKSYSGWDANGDGRIDKAEFERCYRAGGFYRSTYYNPDYWTNYWSAFDANGDGYLSADEYWSAGAWGRIDRNGNGRIDTDEWVWWNP